MTCTKCNLKFVSAKEFQNHMRQIHPLDPSVNQNQISSNLQTNLTYCIKCAKQYGSEEKFHEHMKTVHPLDPLVAQLNSNNSISQKNPLDPLDSNPSISQKNPDENSVDPLGSPLKANHSNLQKNPWSVRNLEEFQYYCCPECNLKDHSRENFLEHALNQHPNSQGIKIDLPHFMLKISRNFNYFIFWKFSKPKVFNTRNF